jgi:hypothetical protein
VALAPVVNQAGLKAKRPAHHASFGAAVATATLNEPSTTTRKWLSETYGKLPLSFVANQGQAAGSVQFLLRGSGYRLYLSSTEAVLVLRNADRGLWNSEQLTESVDSLPQTPFSALPLPHSEFHIPTPAFRIRQCYG